MQNKDWPMMVEIMLYLFVEDDYYRATRALEHLGNIKELIDLGLSSGMLVPSGGYVRTTNYWKEALLSSMVKGYNLIKKMDNKNNKMTIYTPATKYEYSAELDSVDTSRVSQLDAEMAARVYVTRMPIGEHILMCGAAHTVDTNRSRGTVFFPIYTTRCRTVVSYCNVFRGPVVARYKLRSAMRDEEMVL